MPKQIDYPRATLKNSLELANAVDGLGGKSSTEMAAHALNKKVGGAFQALVSSTVKYGLVISKQGQLETTPLFRNHKLAYSDKEAAAILSEAFLSVPLFREICARFENKPIPVNHFEKLLVREFDVPDQMGSRVAKYFLEGAKQCNLLSPDHVVRTGQVHEGDEDDAADGGADKEDVDMNQPPLAETQPLATGSGQIAMASQNPPRSGGYSVRITGPGMDSVISINDEEDLLIVKAMLKKVEKRLSDNPNDVEQ